MSEHGVLESLGYQEPLLAGTDESRDAPAALQHVVEVQPIIFHNGVASRSILSRAYQ
jgi:hypothetical protein